MAPKNEEQLRSSLTTTATMMAPSCSSLADDDDEADGSSDEQQPQYMYIIRHGDRWDYENPTWNKMNTSRVGDPPLSPLGHEQARETGLFLAELLAQDGIVNSNNSSNNNNNNITWLSSPFLRCLQTSTEALNALSATSAGAHQMNNNIPILPEYSVFEWDARGGNWHASLPPLSERLHYFPRLDTSYQSMFVPTLPELSADVFLERCQRTLTALQERFPYRPRTALVIVTHAAACIGLVRAATALPLDEIHPATPCGIYRLQRTTNTSSAPPEFWTLSNTGTNNNGIDPSTRHDTDDDDSSKSRNHRYPLTFNGHWSHVSRMSGKTKPWNHFGPKHIHRGYTGPPTSIFAPRGMREDRNGCNNDDNDDDEK